MTALALSPLANHLWQSTACVAVAWLLALTLRNNRASTRYWVWFAASAKFLIPFSLLISAGNRMRRVVSARMTKYWASRRNGRPERDGPN